MNSITIGNNNGLDTDPDGVPPSHQKPYHLLLFWLLSTHHYTSRSLHSLTSNHSSTPTFLNPCSVLPECDSGSTQCPRGGYPESDSGSRQITAAASFTTLNSNLAELIWNRCPIHALMTSSTILQDWWHVFVCLPLFYGYQFEHTRCHTLHCPTTFFLYSHLL